MKAQGQPCRRYALFSVSGESDPPTVSKARLGEDMGLSETERTRLQKATTEAALPVYIGDLLRGVEDVARALENGYRQRNLGVHFAWTTDIYPVPANAPRE